MQARVAHKRARTHASTRADDLAMQHQAEVEQQIEQSDAALASADAALASLPAQSLTTQATGGFGGGGAILSGLAVVGGGGLAAATAARARWVSASKVGVDRGRQMA